MPTVKGDHSHAKVQEYYGLTLQSSADLKTGACCTSDGLPEYARAILPMIEEEIKNRFYGCGSPIPPDLAGQTVLDLGCGTGRDVYVLSKLVGEEGRVIGVDMTEPQLEVARRHMKTQMRRFGFDQSNVVFHHGLIEDLRSLGIEDRSIDVVVSNCVINLSPDKERVFAEILRVLRPGGELFFCDVFSGRRVPEALRADPVLRGECLGGALYCGDFRRMLERLGCRDPRVVTSRPVPLNDPKIEAQVGMVDFHSQTVRAFKLDSLEDACEDYGQLAIYHGTMVEYPHRFILDEHHTFVAGKPVAVCGNTASMLEETRYARHFTILGDRTTHFGSFDCGVASPASDANGNDPAACC